MRKRISQQFQSLAILRVYAEIFFPGAEFPSYSAMSSETHILRPWEKYHREEISYDASSPKKPVLDAFSRHKFSSCQSIKTCLQCYLTLFSQRRLLQSLRVRIVCCIDNQESTGIRMKPLLTLGILLAVLLAAKCYPG